MKGARVLCFAFLAAAYAIGAGAALVAPHPYEAQDRQHPTEPPTGTHPLGTDDLGRDRLSRLMYGMRTSLLLAPAATLLATAIAAGVGVFAGLARGLVQSCILYLVDTVSGTPWFLALLLVRALLPLNVDAGFSVATTFLLLGALGWPHAVRLVAARTGAATRSTFYIQARACGIRPFRLAAVHLAARLRPVLSAHFWSTMPVFILAEANLSVLGLGVAEPLPSLGNLISELRDCRIIVASPWLLAPAVVLIACVAALQALSRGAAESYDCA